VYVGLELDETQIALRLAGERVRVPRSKLYTGKASSVDRARVVAERQALASLPFYVEPGSPTGWPPSRLQSIAAELRKSHPVGPMLFVVDFLQLIGNEPGERIDLRERIGRAAYVARDLARNYKATILLVSSVARDKYAQVSGYDALNQAGLAGDEARGLLIERFMFKPDAIVGMGKESGEIEYAADSVTVAVSLPREIQDQPKQVVFATAKLRAGQPSWCALAFDGHRFSDVGDGGRSILQRIKDSSNKKPRKPNGTPSAGDSEDDVPAC